MQASPTNPTRTGNPAVQQGILFGIAYAVIAIINSLIAIFANPGAGGAILNIVVFIIALVLFALAGYRASAQTGRVGTGAIAGLLAGLIGALISSIVSVILTIALIDTFRQRAQALAATPQFREAITNQSIIALTIGGAILGIVIALGLGAGLGAIGGAIGRRRAPQPVQYQESMYQGMPPTPPPPSNTY